MTWEWWTWSSAQKNRWRSDHRSISKLRNSSIQRMGCATKNSEKSRVTIQGRREVNAFILCIVINSLKYESINRSPIFRMKMRISSPDVPTVPQRNHVSKAVCQCGWFIIPKKNRISKKIRPDQTVSYRTLDNFYLRRAAISVTVRLSSAFFGFCFW